MTLNVFCLSSQYQFLPNTLFPSSLNLSPFLSSSHSHPHQAIWKHSPPAESRRVPRTLIGRRQMLSSCRTADPLLIFAPTLTTRPLPVRHCPSIRLRRVDRVLSTSSQCQSCLLASATQQPHTLPVEFFLQGCKL